MPEHSVNFVNLEAWQVRAALAGHLRQFRLPVEGEQSPSESADPEYNPEAILRQCPHEPEWWTTKTDIFGEVPPYRMEGDSPGQQCSYCWYPAPFALGDVLRVRETWAVIWTEYEPDRDIGQTCWDVPHVIEYRADTGAPYPGDWPAEEARGNPDAPKWQPSSRMSKEASRFAFTVAGIRAEQAHDMTEADALACGCDGSCGIGSITAYQAGPCVYHYAQVWDAKHGKWYPWESNPWQWCVDLEALG